MIKIRGPRVWTYLLVLPVIAGVAYVGILWGNDTVKTDLEAEGLQNVEVSFQMMTTHFDMACSGKHPTIRHFTATKNGVDVQGTACYQTFVGTKYWIE